MNKNIKVNICDTNESNESNEANETNESNEINESNEVNETNKVNETDMMKYYSTKEWVDSIFNPINNRTEKIMAKIKQGNLQYILNGLCNMKDDVIFIDFKYFKFFAERVTYQLITQVVMNHCDLVLQSFPKFIVHLNISSFNISQLDKHRAYITQISHLFANKYPDTLKICYVYNASFVFAQLFNIISLFVDKDTLQKVHLIPYSTGSS